MSTKHTPGEWTVQGERIVARRETILDACTCSITSPEEVDANLRLAASAPAMFEALKGLQITIRNLAWDAQQRRPWTVNSAANLRLVAESIAAVLAQAEPATPAQPERL